VQNLFPLVTTAGAGAPTGAAGTDPAAAVGADGIGTAAGTARADAFPATGAHEVVIESPRHDWDLRTASPGQALTVLSAIQERCRALARQAPAAIVVFRNHGVAGGTSLTHPHSQIVTLDRPPPGLLRRWRIARDHHDGTQRRLHDDIRAAERDGPRVVADTDGLLVFHSRAAEVPYETVILPGDGAPDLATASDEALAAVAATLPKVLDALARLLGDPGYNLVVRAGPTNVADARYWYQWHLTVHPRTTTPAGLEIATELSVNPIPPEVSAPAMRRTYAGGTAR
jgi:UDPglucose--hexose-1-phosphate uridylyltransferase